MASVGIPSWSGALSSGWYQAMRGMSHRTHQGHLGPLRCTLQLNQPLFQSGEHPHRNMALQNGLCTRRLAHPTASNETPWVSDGKQARLCPANVSDEEQASDSDTSGESARVDSSGKTFLRRLRGLVDLCNVVAATMSDPAMQSAWTVGYTGEVHALVGSSTAISRSRLRMSSILTTHDGQMARMGGWGVIFFR